MTIKEPAIIVYCTCPDAQVAEQLAAGLLEKRLAACINIVSGVTSHYLWQGKLEKEAEHLLLIKSTNRCYSALEEDIKKMHPYELPEIIAVPIDRGSPEYIQWIQESVS